MIPITEAQEPLDFARTVRAPGNAFLMDCPNPTERQFRSHSYWSRARSDLLISYGRICAYSCHYIAADTGADTVEHFAPKSVYPHLAYEWSNYRLVCGRLNGRKGVYEDILDPFTLRKDLFQLKLPSLLLTPLDDIPKNDKAAVNRTISRLKLNDDETCVEARLTYMLDYLKNNITIDYLREKAPFIYKEITRQQLDIATLRNMFSLDRE